MNRIAGGGECIHNIFVPTTVHVPKPLLAAVDRKARALRVSRNGLIVRALQREVDERGWTPGFFDRLRDVDGRTSAVFGRSMIAVRASRRTKRPPRL
jgi:hypothetical protein